MSTEESITRAADMACLAVFSGEVYTALRQARAAYTRTKNCPASEEDALCREFLQSVGSLRSAMENLDSTRGGSSTQIYKDAEHFLQVCVF
jgi:hypothetical protein